MSELPEKSDINSLKTKINKHEKTINDLNDEIAIVNKYRYYTIISYIYIRSL